jgi:hypothetical protein
MANLGRLLAVIVGVLLVIGAAVFLFFRSSIASEGVYQVATAVGLDVAAPERHVVPEGFQGWAVVHYGVVGAPPLREDNGAQIVEYPANGRLETSTPAPNDEGFLHRGYYFRTADGLSPLSRAGDIWGEYSHRKFEDLDAEAIHRKIQEGGVVSIHRSSGFFVGTMKEFLATEWPAEHGTPSEIRE